MHESKTKIASYSLKDILNILGEEAVPGSEFHVHHNEEPIAENPFPYPFRSNNAGFLILLSGQLKVQVNLEIFIVRKGDIMLFSTYSIVQILEVLEPVRSIGIVFTEEFALKNLLNYEELRVLRFIELNETPVLVLSESSYTAIIEIFFKLYNLNTEEVHNNNSDKAKIFHYFNLLTLEIMEVYNKYNEQFDRKANKTKEIIHKFLSLLSMYVKEKRNVQFYADKLFITSGHLSKLLKESAGLSAREIIEEAVVMEARNLLMDKSLSLAEISEMLNFADQSFFGKYFKKKMQISPKVFRDNYK